MTEAKRKALRAEAKAWRVLAEDVAACPWGYEVGLCYRLTYCDGQMQAQQASAARRVRRHADGNSTGAYLHYTIMTTGGFYRRTGTPHARVIFCLLMALECEEEARGR